MAAAGLPPDAGFVSVSNETWAHPRKVAASCGGVDEVSVIADDFPDLWPLGLGRRQGCL